MVLPSHDGLFGRQVSRPDYSAQDLANPLSLLFFF